MPGVTQGAILSQSRKPWLYQYMLLYHTGITVKLNSNEGATSPKTMPKLAYYMG